MYASAQSAPQTIGANAFGQDMARQLEIPAGMSRLDMQIAGLAEAVSRLDERLTGAVARPQAPSPEGKAGQLKAPTQCGLGGHIDALGDHVQGMRDRLCSLLDRLEV